ncbi:MAG: hypothetical protein KUG78_08530 [Kangiellaceae bacterium]|nr:hypothetical protein [Kangiellaceae bacterium]
MQIGVSIHTYNTYGGHSTISLAGDFLELGIGDFGTSIEELEIHVYFQGGHAKKTLESLFDQYHNFIKGLPSTKFYRKKNRFELNILSELGDSSLVKGYGPPKLGLFIDSTKEIVAALASIKAKLKKGDQFDFDAFLLSMQKRINDLPETEEEFTKLQQLVDDERKRKRDAMDEWEKLGVDWIDYHPQAREILDSPFYWNCADDFSPNGNDTGADVLGFYEEWRPKNKKRSGISFFDNLMSDWKVSLPPDESDDYARQTYEDSILGLAFAQLKIDGTCEQKIGCLAVNAIDGIKKRMTELHQDWDLFEERMKTLEIMNQKLNESAMV